MRLYFWLIRLASLFNDKARLLSEGERASLDYLERTVDHKSRYVWFHAASVGEFEQARPVMEMLRREQPEKKILLTFFSPSGYELRKNYSGADIVAYLPFATKSNARRFLDIVNPETAVFVKYEYWKAYLQELQNRHIPTYIFAALFRKNQLFFKWYGGWYRRLLKCFTHLFVQDEMSRQLLADYGIVNADVAGDTRFDRVRQIAAHAADNKLLETFCSGDKPVLIAGSTWPPDEELLIRYFDSHESFKLLLVPHELNKQHIEQLHARLDGKALFYTEAEKSSAADARCMVLDTMGMLSSAYRYGDVAYIGGGFGVGIHNTLEAAVYGMPVVFGPNHKGFREAVELRECGGGFAISGYEELEQVLDQQLADPKAAGTKAADYVAANTGATEIIYNKIFNKQQ